MHEVLPQVSHERNSCRRLHVTFEVQSTNKVFLRSTADIGSANKRVHYVNRTIGAINAVSSCLSRKRA
jgi:hypothetical protein